MEKFDPSDPKYKKVEDLPLEVQDRFVDTVNGEDHSVNGFVRKGVYAKEQAQKEAGKLVPAQNETGGLNLQPTRWQKILFALGGTPEFSHPTAEWLKNEDSVIGPLFTELWTKEADKALDKWSDDKILQARELYRAHISNWIERQIDLARMKAFEEQRLELEKIGHTGSLVINVAYSKKAVEIRLGIDGDVGTGKYVHPREGMIVEGEIDGKHISLVQDDGYLGEPRYEYYAGNIDFTIELTKTEAKRLYKLYSPIALDINEFDALQRAVNEKALASLDDETIDQDVKDMYQKFLSNRTSAEKKEDWTGPHSSDTSLV